MAIKNEYITQTFRLWKLWEPIKTFRYENTWKLVSTNTLIDEYKNVYILFTLDTTNQDTDFIV